MLKKEKHPIMNGRIYEIVFVLTFVLLCATMVVLQNMDILPSSRGLILTGLLIIIGIPYFIIDVKRDIKIKEMYEYYQKENKILEIKDDSKILKTVLIVEIIATLLLISYIVVNYRFDIFNNNQEEIFNFTTNSGEIIETEFYDFDNGNFLLKIPKDFYVMDQEMINVKYPNGNPPSFVLTNDKTTINIAVNITNVPMKNSQIKSYIDAMIEQLSDVSPVIHTRFERNNHEVGEIKFTSKAVDTNIYNHMIAFSDNGMLRIVSFNCTEELQRDWQEVGDFIINSITFK